MTVNAVELRGLEVEDLLLRLGELSEELFNLRFQLATGQLDNHRRLREVRRDVARIRTVMRERELEIWERQRSARQQTEAAPQAAPEEASGPGATDPEIDQEDER